MSVIVPKKSTCFGMSQGETPEVVQNDEKVITAYLGVDVDDVAAQ